MFPNDAKTNTKARIINTIFLITIFTRKSVKNMKKRHGWDPQYCLTVRTPVVPSSQKLDDTENKKRHGWDLNPDAFQHGIFVKILCSDISGFIRTHSS